MGVSSDILLVCALVCWALFGRRENHGHLFIVSTISGIDDNNQLIKRVPHQDQAHPFSIIHNISEAVFVQHNGNNNKFKRAYSELFNR